MSIRASFREIGARLGAVFRKLKRNKIDIRDPGHGRETAPDEPGPIEAELERLTAARASAPTPYRGLDARAYWRTGVAEQDAPAFADLYRKKFTLDRSHKIATAGSCFAQHIARRLSDAGFAVIDKEPAPPGFRPDDAKRFGYGLYSARYGNIYTARQLLQLAKEAFGDFQPADPVWRCGDRFFDALRLGVEPIGLASEEEVRAHRERHLKAVRQVLKQADVLVFTFGLTEAWVHRASGTVYPTAPGVIAGAHDRETFVFANFTHAETLADFIAFRELVRRANPGAKFLLTVSPVPLTATASGDHVLAATTYSKATLRSVAGELRDRFDDVDYFPSYEIVAGHPSCGKLFEEDMRSVSAEGVDVVMRAFFEAHGLGASAPADDAPKRPRKPSKQDAVCEEMLLETFAK